MSTKPSDVVPRIVAALKTAKLPSEPWCEGTLAVDQIGLTIAGVGPIGLPLRPADVRNLAQVARPAPYGKRTETIVDTSVRNTLEIDAEDVTFSRELTQAIDGAVKEASEQLRLDNDRLHVELYKLLIYTKGGFFLPHRDSEKQRGMVATMIVVLPSRFSGGDLRIRHGNRQKTFSLKDARGPLKTRFVVFFADCEHEVKKVASGVRVCLAFNLILAPARKSSGDSSSSTADPHLQRAVNDWLRHRASDPLVFALEHQYTTAGLKPDLLKGADRELFQQMTAVCQSSDCLLHFGQVSRHLSQFADDGSFEYGRRNRRRWSGNYDELEIGEAYEDEIVIDGWKSADGKRVQLAPLACESTQVISATPVEEWTPTRQDYEGYTGNAGNTLDRWYHKSAIITWPRTTHFEVIAQMNLEFAIKQLQKLRQQLPKLSEGKKVEQARHDCKQLAEAIIRHWPSRIYESSNSYSEHYSHLQDFAQEIARFDDPELLGFFLRTVAERDWQCKLDVTVLTSLKGMGVAEVLPHLQDLIDFEPPPNQYGIRFLEGLAKRDASWLLKLARDRKHGGLSPKQVKQLVERAATKLTEHAQRCEMDHRHRSSQQPTEPWQTLCKAAIAVKSSALGALLGLATKCERVFDLRQVQVAAAVELRNFAYKQLGEAPPSLSKWIDKLRAKLLHSTASHPQRPADFIRESTTGCNCKYCKLLSQFLADPFEEGTPIAAGERDREHLKQVIHRRQLDVTTTLVRSGRPYSLYCTKTCDSYKRTLERYQADLKLLESLEQE